ncbi:MAG: hypothetical protein ACYDBJ_28235 [Aggregatilineales bacterium]
MVANNQDVSIASVIRQAKILDPEGRGISHTAILRNTDARTYYEQHRTWTRKTNRQVHPSSAISTSVKIHIQLDRDVGRVRQRYLQMSKQELAERLIQSEQLYAEAKEQWLQRQDEVLIWRLQSEAWRKRAEEAEKKLTEDMHQ